MQQQSIIALLVICGVSMAAASIVFDAHVAFGMLLRLIGMAIAALGCILWLLQPSYRALDSGDKNVMLYDLRKVLS